MRITFIFLTMIFAFTIVYCTNPQNDQSLNTLKSGFLNPPDSARPGVYWYFMDGNMSKEAMTADLESMKSAGIGNVLFLEVNIGVPRGKVNLLSEQWQDMFAHAVKEAERLGITISLGVGPGWSGSGGPWVSGHESMQHLVSSVIKVSGNSPKPLILPKPVPKAPYFGEGAFTPELKKRWNDFYEDVAVLAFPTPSEEYKISDIDEKALYYRAPYTSVPGTKQFLPSIANYSEPSEKAVVKQNGLIDITQYLKPDGSLDWKVPKGNWTIMRLGSRNNGAVTRPAPMPGVGFEADKFDTTAINAHMANFTGKLFKKTGIPDKNKQGGLKWLHMDSWEMGAQNWSPKFREEFKKRRGYDPLPYYPVYAGLVVESLEKSERFLWNLRQTGQELVIENHARHLKKYGQKYNMGFSIEPYDMNPTADMELGAIADVPMCEFWSKGYGFNSSFSCIQAASIAHINGAPVMAAEAFTAAEDAWRQYPGSMKNQGDWAYATGINKFVYHTFQHQYLSDDLKPGMTMGPYGVHWDRSQTWWPMAEGYHKYVGRCQYMLQQGKTVADILYLTPEGAPHVFKAPASALTGDEFLPDRREYNFDGCSPSQLLTASVKDNRIVFPSGATYRLLVLPASPTMTPALLNKIESLLMEGAVIVGNPPIKSPSLVNYPDCDQEVALKAMLLWGKFEAPKEITELSKGKGKIYWGGKFSNLKLPELYPEYNATIEILKQMKVKPDFISTGPVRYTHHIQDTGDLYFVSNRTNESIDPVSTFRADKGSPELWDPLTGTVRPIEKFKKSDNQTEIPLHFEPYQSYFIHFNKNKTDAPAGSENFPQPKIYSDVKGPWNVSFNPRWGGPKSITFENLSDWTKSQVEGIRYYSGIANYHNTIEISKEKLADKKSDLFLNLGEVCQMARVKLNGKDLGVVWTAPFEMNITDALVPGINQLDIEVANLWANRLIGDEQFQDDGIKNNQWPEWIEKKLPRTSGRFTFTTFKYYKKDSQLIRSGLIGPVRILERSK